MSRIRKLIQKSRSTVGLQLALALLVPAKGKAAHEVKPKTDRKDGSDTTNETMTAPPHLTGRWDFSRLFQVAADPDIVSTPEYSLARVNEVAHNAVELASASTLAEKINQSSATDDGFVPKPMSHEEVRLWLQSFNAGPYALLKYKGDVPYKETQNYVPKVLKAFEEDPDTEYESHIRKYAKKYGLDPQLVKAIMKTESNFNKETVSHAGARGLMQVMPVVWKDVKEKYDLNWEYSSEVFEPEKNIEVACAYLAWLRYDFLPRHFDAFEQDPEAPLVLVRDKDRGVPDRESPRIVASAAVSDSNLVNKGIVLAAAAQPEVTSTASDASAKDVADSGAAKADVSAAKEEPKKVEPKSQPKDEKSSPKAEAKPKAETKPKVEISDAGGESTKRNSNGKTRVVMRGGEGKSVKITVANGKVSKSKSASEGNGLKRKSAELARAKERDKEESQGG